MSLKIALSPLIGPQALLARRRARLLPEPPGPRRGRAGTGAPLRLLITGDSSAAGVGCERQSQALSGRLAARLSGGFDLTWEVAARTGAVTAEVPGLLEGAGPAGVAVVSVGLNDVTRGTPLRLWLEQRAALFERLAPARLVVSGLPPLGAFPALPQPLRWVMGRERDRYEAAGRAQVEAMGHEFAPLDLTGDVSMMAEDGFHPGPAIYDLWAADLAPRIVALARRGG